MRQRDLRTDVAYATCDGNYVKLVDTAVSYYWDYSHGTRKIVKSGGDDSDPWGGCMNAERPVRRGRGKPMLKAKQYEVDRDGKPLGDGDDTLVKLVDIKGTWAEFMSLYAADVEKRADKRTMEENAADFWKRMGEAFGAAGLRSQVRMIRPFKYNEKRIREQTSTFESFELSITATTREQLYAIAAALGIELPADTYQMFTGQPADDDDDDE